MAQHTDNQCDILTHIGCPQSVQKTAFPVLSEKKKNKKKNKNKINGYYFCVGLEKISFEEAQKIGKPTTHLGLAIW